MDNESITELSQKVSDRLEALYGKELVEGLSLSKYRVLSILEKRGSLSIKSIVEITGKVQSSVSEVTERMVRTGLVEKVKNPYDGRASIVSITRKGQEQLHRCKEKQQVLYKEFLSRLSEAEQQSLIKTLEHLTRLFDKLDYRASRTTSSSAASTTIELI